MSELRDFLRAEGYEVTEDGRVFSKKCQGHVAPAELRPKTDRDGYLQIGLTTKFGKRSIKVHVLVAEFHLPPRPSPFHEVRHLDNTRNNNNVGNLAWGTKAENCMDRSRNRAKTVSQFCKAGHPRNSENFSPSKDGTMRCRACGRQRMRKYYQLKREQASIAARKAGGE